MWISWKYIKMTEKEKAVKLYNQFYQTSSHTNSVKRRHEQAKENAKMCVDEILSYCSSIYESDMVHFIETSDGEFLLNVKLEIDKI